MKQPNYRCIFLFALLIFVLLSGCEKKHMGLETGERMPAVSLSTHDGKLLHLPDDYRGKILLVRFWSIDCHFCDKKILLGLDALYQKYQAQGFVPIAVNESEPDKTDARMQQFSALAYPMLYDLNNAAARRFGIVALPVTYVFDEEGILRQKLTGEASLEEYEKLFTTVINKGTLYESNK